MRPLLRITSAALALAVIALLGWTAFGDPGVRERAESDPLLVGAPGLAGAPGPGDRGEPGGPEDPALAGPGSGGGLEGSSLEAARTEGLGGAPVARTRPFEGEALLQVGDALPSQVRTGSFTLEVLEQAQVERVQVPVTGSRFEVQVPERARLRLVGGVFNGQRVRFPGLGTAFAPADSAHALVGVPFPLNRLVVLDGPSGAGLGDVRITRAPAMNPVTLRGQAADEAVVLEGGSSPVDLPWIESRTPLWLRVGADGYAPATVRVDPLEERTREVRLWPAADLLVRVTGDGREALRMISIFHEDPEGRVIAGGVIERRAAGVSSDGAAWVFDLEGVPGLPTRIEAKGVDLKARPVDLAETNVGLQPGERRTAVLRLDR
ncbi:MAG: hypothetical protein PVJ89_00780 [Planctomycetota bacterium]|jgi:hypothetical protein